MAAKRTKYVNLRKVYLKLLFYFTEYLEAAKTVLIINGIVAAFKYFVR